MHNDTGEAHLCRVARLGKLDANARQANVKEH